MRETWCDSKKEEIRGEKERVEKIILNKKIMDSDEAIADEVVAIHQFMNK
jgi:hypothetical protein